ncbi:MAG: glycosyltransferase family 2 protein [Defluviitaleaceae bacterium]|nr:glycosyltransferase family 2 protein [Defluviitaleaceae bacterium]
MYWQTRKTIRRIPGALYMYRTLKSSYGTFYNKFIVMIRNKRTLSKIRAYEQKDKLNLNALLMSDRDFWVKKCEDIIFDPTHEYNDFKKAVLAIKAFYTNPIECLKAFTHPPKDDDVILLVTVKDNCTRIDHFLKHYRNLGVRHFAFIDNGSVDGTVEKVIEQTDTSCFRANIKYNSARKTGWFNRVAAHYGANRWYIVVDSDELFEYPASNVLNIQNLIRILDKKNLPFLRAVLIDVYPNGILMDATKSDNDYLEDCVYFDRLDGSTKFNKDGTLRNRLFSVEEKGQSPSPNKPALLKFTDCFLLSSHVVYPRKYNNTPFGAVCLHYKFLPSDREKYIKIAQEGNYYKGSWVYKAVNEKIEESPEIYPMCELSVMFNRDTAWQYLPFIYDAAEGFDGLFLTGEHEKTGRDLYPEQDGLDSHVCFMLGLLNASVFENGINNVLEVGGYNGMDSLLLLREGCKRDDFNLYRVCNISEEDTSFDRIMHVADDVEKLRFHKLRHIDDVNPKIKIDMVLIDGARLHPLPFFDLLFVLPFLHGESLILISSVGELNPTRWGGSVLYDGWADERYRVSHIDENGYPKNKAYFGCLKLPTSSDELKNVLMRIAKTPFQTARNPQESNLIKHKLDKALSCVQKTMDDNFAKEIESQLFSNMYDLSNNQLLLMQNAELQYSLYKKAIAVRSKKKKRG